MKSQTDAIIARATRDADGEPGTMLLSEDNLFDGRNVFGGAWHSDDSGSSGGAPKIAPARLDFAAKEGVTLALWLRPDADNPRERPIDFLAQSRRLEG